MKGPELAGTALSWADEHKRIFKLFEENLKKKSIYL